MKQENFFHFTNFLDLPPEVIEEAKNANYEWWATPNNFRADTTTFFKTDLFRIIVERFGYCNAAFYKNLPFTYYDWHTDMNRQASVNFVIQGDEHAHCFFRDLIDSDPYSKEILERGYSSPLFWQLQKVEYNLFKPTILRSQSKHCVVNVSPNDRIILSLSIGRTTTSYNEIKQFLSSLIFSA